MGEREALLVVVNQSAGSAAERAQRALRVLREHPDLTVVHPRDLDECRDALAGAAGARPVVLGGDGTLHTVVRLLHELGTLGDAPLGLVPTGTANDFARTMGISAEPEQAARTVLDGQIRDVEIIEDDTGGVAVNAVHVGIGAEAARRGQRWKPRLGMLAYRVGALSAGLTQPGWRLRVEADGQVLADAGTRVLMVGLAVGRTIAGTPLAPDADVSDGVAEVVVSFATGPLARAGYAATLLRGRHGGRRDVTATRARTITVSGEPFPVNADGELSGPIPHRTWTVRADAWRLTVPR